MGTPRYEMSSDPLVAFFANPERAAPEAALHQRGVDREMLKSVYQQYVQPNIKDITLQQFRDPHTKVDCQQDEEGGARQRVASLEGVFCVPVLDVQYRSNQTFRERITLKVWLLRNGTWAVWSNFIRLRQQIQAPPECVAEWCSVAPSIDILIETLDSCLAGDMHLLGSRPTNEPAYFPLKLVNGLHEVFKEEEKRRARRAAAASSTRQKIATVLSNVAFDVYS